MFYFVNKRSAAADEEMERRLACTTAMLRGPQLLNAALELKRMFD